MIWISAIVSLDVQHYSLNTWEMLQLESVWWGSQVLTVLTARRGPGQIILINWERERERERERTWPGYHLPPVIITSLSPWLRSLTCLGLSSTSPIISISQLKFYPISSLSWQSCRPYIDSRQTPPLLLCCQIQIFCSCFVKVTFR